MEITRRWKNRAISFWETVATILGNRCGFWNCSKPAELGHLGRPTTDIGATCLGLPKWVELGPVTWAQSLVQSALDIWASPVLVQSGPITRAQGDAWLAPITGFLQCLGAKPKSFLAQALASRSPRIRWDLILPRFVQFESDSNKWLSDNHLGFRIPV